MGNILDTLRPLLGGDKLEQISRWTGDSPAVTKRALETAVPASVVGLADHASTQQGAQTLLDGLRSNQVPQLEPDEIGRVLSDPESSERVVTQGNGFAQRVFGNKLDGVATGISGQAGTTSSATRKLLGLAMPLVLGFIGKKALGDRLDARGLGRFLGEQKGLMSSMLPASLLGLLGVAAVRRGGELGRDERAGYGEVRHVTPTERRGYSLEPHSRSGVSRYLPWVLGALAVIFGLGYLINNRAKKAETTARVTATAPELRAPESPAAPEAQAPTVAEPEQPAAPAPGVAEEEDIEPVAGQAANEISSYLDGNPSAEKRFTTRELTFVLGSAELTPESMPFADQLAKALVAHPEAKVRIEGFTDSTGSTSLNNRLSLGRANALKQYLIEHDVGSDRIETAGRGSASPVAPNDTEENREMNRRIEIVVMP